MHGKDLVQMNGAMTFCEAQREKFIELRIQDPTLRIRDHTALGPRVSINVKKTQRSGLKKPKSYFIEIDVYKRDNPGIEVDPKAMCWEEIDGIWKQGVSFLVLHLFYGAVFSVRSPKIVFLTRQNDLSAC